MRKAPKVQLVVTVSRALLDCPVLLDLRVHLEKTVTRSVDRSISSSLPCLLLALSFKTQSELLRLKCFYSCREKSESPVKREAKPTRVNRCVLGGLVLC